MRTWTLSLPLALATLLLPGTAPPPWSVTKPSAAWAQAAEEEEQKAEALRLLNLCREHLGNEQAESALKSCQEAIRLYQQLADRSGEAKATVNLGIAYNRAGEYEQAIAPLQSALDIARAIGDGRVEAIAQKHLGDAHEALGQTQQAAAFHQQAQDYLEKKTEADELNEQGIQQYGVSQFREALQSWQEALAIYQEIDDRQGEANSLTNLGNAYYSPGQYQQAIDFYLQSLAVARKISDRAVEGKALNNLGIVYYSLGQYEQAIDFYQQSLAIKREIGEAYGTDSVLRQGEANSLTNLGNVYHSLGQYEQAIDFHQQSLAIAREIVNREGEANSLGNLGNAYYSLGQYEQAIDFHQQSLAIDQEIGDRAGEAASLNNLGSAYLSLGQYKQAIDFHQQSLAIEREIDNRAGEAGSFNSLGAAYYFLGQYEQAIDFHQQSLAIMREIGDRAGEATSLNDLGAAYLETNQLSEAESALFESIRVSESLHTNLSNPDRVSLFDTQIRAYTNLQKALIAQGKTDNALEIAERGRARAFVELLAQQLSSSAEAALTRETQQAITPPSIEQIRQIARQQDATLVQYSEIFNEALFIWVVQPTGEISFRQVALNASDSQPSQPPPPIPAAFQVAAARGPEQTETAVSDLVSKTRASVLVTANRNSPDQSQQFQQLYQLLIDPIAELLPTNPEARIIFIPQGEIFLIPFPALRDPEGTYLVEKHTLLTAPSIQVLDLTRKQHQQVRSSSAKTLNSAEMLIVGNPTMPTLPALPGEPALKLRPLPGAEQEAQAIAEFFDAEAITGTAATETAIAQQISDAQIIHLATHGLLQYGIPEETLIQDIPGAIALAPSETDDGLLTASEILEMQLKAELVVLSACDTGRGRITGDGVIGLSRSLITAGVPSVVVSLWSVPDAPTAELMTEFYRQLQQTPDKAQALRQAMLMTKERHPNPRDWAAFTLIGEAK